MEYRRFYILGGTYFFTLVTYNRHPIFTTPESIEKLRAAFRYTLDRHPFTYNPVKHGLVKAPADWKYSSFAKYVRDGFYPVNWGGGENSMAAESWME